MLNRSIMTMLNVLALAFLGFGLQGSGVAQTGAQIVFEQSEAPALNLNADNCEFYVDGVAEAYMYDDGHHIYRMLVELVSLVPSQTLGGWVRYRDRESGIVGEAFFAGKPNEDSSRWTAEFDIDGVANGVHFSRDILEFAFFGDGLSRETNREPVPVRYWISNGGRNYSWKAIMAEPTYVVRDGQTEKRWADARAGVFDQKRVCARR